MKQTSKANSLGKRGGNVSNVGFNQNPNGQPAGTPSMRKKIGPMGGGGKARDKKEKMNLKKLNNEKKGPEGKKKPP